MFILRMPICNNLIICNIVYLFEYKYFIRLFFLSINLNMVSIFLAIFTNKLTLYYSHHPNGGH